MKRVASFVAVLALALASSAIAQVQTGSILVKAVDEQGAVMPGASITISSPVLVAGSMTGVTDAGGVNRFPSLVPGTYTIKVELSGFTTDHAREHRGARRPDHAGGVRDEGRGGGREHHRDRRIADGRHDERERRRQLEQRTASGHAGRTRSLGPARSEGPGPQHEPTGRGRNVGRAAGRLQRARHDRGAEHPVPQRRQRRRPGGDRVRGLLLRLRLARGRAGIDGRARHHRADRRRVPEHGDQERRQQVAGHHHAHLAQRCDASAQRHRPDVSEVRDSSGQQHVDQGFGRERRRRRPADERQAAFLRHLSRLARRDQRPGAELPGRPRPDEHQ